MALDGGWGDVHDIRRVLDRQSSEIAQLHHARLLGGDRRKGDHRFVDVGLGFGDVRRGDGPKPCFNYTMASIATSDSVIERSPTAAPAAVRAIGGAHAALKKDVTLATKIGRKLFPPAEAELIAELIGRDLPYYDTTISRDFVTGMNRFARDVGIMSGDVPYKKIVAMAN